MNYASMNEPIESPFKITIPVLLGYISIGIPFGILVTQNGYSWWLAPFMSIFMYAGAAQYVAIGLFSAQENLLTICITTLALNIRHIVYGLSLLDSIQFTGKWKPYIIFGLTDETYALLSCHRNLPKEKIGTFYGKVTLYNHLYWIIGSLLGAVLGSFIKIPLEGIDFSLTALFIVLLINQIKAHKQWVSSFIGIATGSLCALFFGKQNMIITSLCFGIAFILLLRQPLFTAKDEKGEKP